MKKIKKNKNKKGKSKTSNGGFKKISGCEEYFPLLQDFLPLYATITRQDVARMHLAITNKRELSQVLEGRSAAWVKAAYEELCIAETNAEQWVHMDEEDLATLELGDVGDFSLGMLSTMLFDRGTDIDLANRALVQISNNARGSVLVDYDWYYRDVAQYEICEEEEDHLMMYKKAIQHNLAYGNGEGVTSLLSGLASDLFHLNRMDEGVDKLACLVHATPFDYDLWSGMVSTFLTMKQYRVAHWMLEQARRTAPGDGSFNEELTLFESMLKKREESDNSPKSALLPWEEKIRALLHRIPTMKPEDMRDVLGIHLFSELLSVPVKTFAA